MKATNKAPQIENVLFNIANGVDRKSQIAANLCMPSPIGCGKKITHFEDDISKREYQLSGMCQACQNAFFVDDE